MGTIIECNADSMFTIEAMPEKTHKLIKIEIEDKETEKRVSVEIKLDDALILIKDIKTAINEVANNS